MNLEKIKQLFYNVKIPNEFGGNVEDDSYDWVLDWLEEHIIPYLEGRYEICHGVSKVVLVPDEGDYVIKIPFNGTYESCYDDNGDFEDEFWTEFYQAPEECGWDYCATEVEIYEKAKEHNIECFFAKTEFLCTSKNYHPIYIQEKVRTRYGFDSDLVKPSEKSLKDYKEKYKNDFNSGGVFKDNDWVALCLDKYGMEIIKKFSDFLYNNPNVNYDMHTDNYGFRLDKTPCLIDFSGWCEYN